MAAREGRHARARLSQRVRTFAAITAVLLWGCSHAVSLQVPVVAPAAVPVRAFPEIWLSGGHFEEDVLVLDGLETTLRRDGRHRVHRVDRDELEPLRRAGRIPQGSVVVVVEVELQEDRHQSYDMAPMPICGPYGCDTQYQSVVTDVPWIRGVATVRVHEGPTARLLQRHVVRADRYGGDPFELRQNVARELSEQVARAVDVGVQWEQVRLLRVKTPSVEEAIERATAGDWPGAREVLERALGSAELQALSAKERARAFHDLALARRFAPGEAVTEADFAAAAEALQQAAQLDPAEPAHGRALHALTAHREAQERLWAQQRAARHNFALEGKGEPPLPEPPPSYADPVSPVPAPEAGEGPEEQGGPPASP